MSHTRRMHGRLFQGLVLSVLLFAPSVAFAQSPDNGAFHVTRPRPVAENSPKTLLAEGSVYCRIPEAREKYDVDGSDIVVAVIDSGIDLSHPDFEGRILPGRDFVDSDDTADDMNGHGTHVAGIVGASKLHTGVAPKARIVPLKVFGRSGNGTFVTVTESLQW